MCFRLLCSSYFTHQGEIAFWSPAQAVNFYFLPPQFRVMYLGVVSLVWTAYMSFIQYEYGKVDDKVNDTDEVTEKVIDVTDKVIDVTVKDVSS